MTRRTGRRPSPKRWRGTSSSPSRRLGRSDQAFLFARVCYTVAWFDRTLGLHMAEAYIPTAHMVLVADPMGGFRGLDDIVTGTLRVFDVLGVFIGKLKADARCWKNARAECAADSTPTASPHSSQSPPQEFPTGGLLPQLPVHLRPKEVRCCRRQTRLGEVGRSNRSGLGQPPHEAEVLIGVLSVGKSQRGRVARFIMENAHRIEKFPPRLALVSPEIAIEHLNAGRQVRLVQYPHVEWDYGAVLVEMLADNRPGLLTTFLAPHEEGIAKGLSGQNASWFAESGPFLNALREHAPGHLSSILAQVDVLAASKGWRCRGHARGDLASADLASHRASDRPARGRNRRQFVSAAVCRRDGRLDDNRLRAGASLARRQRRRHGGTQARFGRRIHGSVCGPLATGH